MTVRRATLDAESVGGLGAVVVPATYGAIDEASATHRLERWWSGEARVDGPTLAHVDGHHRAAVLNARRGSVETRRTTFEEHPHLGWVWMRKELS